MWRIHDILQSANRRAIWASVAILAFVVLGIISEYQRGELRHGRVLDQAGNPIADAYVQLVIHMSFPENIIGRRVLNHVFTQTDSLGRFTIQSHWKEMLWRDFPYNSASDRVSIEVCHRDFSPQEFVDRNYDNGPAVLNHRGLVRGNRDEVILKLSRRSPNSSVKWGGAMMWEPNIKKACRLIDFW